MNVALVYYNMYAFEGMVYIIIYHTVILDMALVNPELQCNLQIYYKYYT